MTKYFLLFFSDKFSRLGFPYPPLLCILKQILNKTNTTHFGIYTFVESTDAMPEEFEIKKIPPGPKGGQ